MRREAGSPAGRPGAPKAMDRDRGAGGTLEGHWENADCKGEGVEELF